MGVGHNAVIFRIFFRPIFVTRMFQAHHTSKVGTFIKSEAVACHQSLLICQYVLILEVRDARIDPALPRSVP